MRVLVCGGRNYGEVPKGMAKYTPTWSVAFRKAMNEEHAVFEGLDKLDPRPTAIIHGAASGADRHAMRWALANNITHIPFAANWFPNGFGRMDKSAGPIRNQLMIDDGKPDLVIAFPGGKGTEDMVRRARAAGIEVREIKAVSTPNTGWDRSGE